MADNARIEQLLEQISEAGQQTLNDNPSSGTNLISTLALAQREIEGPGAYLTRTRFAVNPPRPPLRIP